jgi:two-component system, OmpR family, sensor kinase
MIDDLFKLAKLDLKGMKPDREPFSFGELVADVVQKLQAEAAARQIGLRVDSPQRTPFVFADVSLMEQVLDRLIGHAIRTTPSGGHVSVTISMAGGRVQTQVADTGSAIEAAELPFIFDRFYRDSNARSQHSEGAGLGLAITKRILELHDTSISVESDREAGTRFTFALPVHEASRQPV